jgi:hypothetical protein
MCITSLVMQYGRDQIPFTQWTRPVFNEYQEILRRLEDLDEKLAQPDCEDPAKAAWMREVEERLTAIENEKVA